MPEFKGLKLCQDGNACATYRDLHRVELNKDTGKPVLMVDVPGMVGGGGNSGFQTLNLTVQFGVRRIALVGFDMHSAGGLHWHGAHSANLNNPNDSNFVKWRAGLDGIAGDLAEIGVEVIDTSIDGALSAYPKMTLEAAIEKWGIRGDGNDSDRGRLPGKQRGSGEHGGAVAQPA